MVILADKPSPVRDVKVTDITAETATITWQTPEDDGGKPITLYIVERREANRRTWNKIGDSTSLEFSVSNLVENNQYVFRIFAQNDVGLSEPTESDTITAKNPFGQFLYSNLYYKKKEYRFRSDIKYSWVLDAGIGNRKKVDFILYEGFTILYKTKRKLN